MSLCVFSSPRPQPQPLQQSASSPLPASGHPPFPSLVYVVLRLSLYDPPAPIPTELHATPGLARLMMEWNGTQQLVFGHKFNHPIAGMKEWPPNLRLLSFGYEFNQSVASVALPPRLEVSEHSPAVGLVWAWHLLIREVPSRRHFHKIDAPFFF